MDHEKELARLVELANGDLDMAVRSKITYYVSEASYALRHGNRSLAEKKINQAKRLLAP